MPFCRPISLMAVVARIAPPNSLGLSGVPVKSSTACEMPHMQALRFLAVRNSYTATGARLWGLEKRPALIVHGDAPFVRFALGAL